MPRSARRARPLWARTCSALSACLLLLISSGTILPAYAQDGAGSSDPSTVVPADADTSTDAPDAQAEDVSSAGVDAQPAPQQAPAPTDTPAPPLIAAQPPASPPSSPPVDTAVQPRRGSFIYATHLANPNGNAQKAQAAGFNHMWAFVPWSAIEPSPGTFVFQQKDQWGKTKPNDLTNVVQAARSAGLHLVLRLDSSPDWAGGQPDNVSPAAVEEYVYQVVKYAVPTIDMVDVFNELNLPPQWGGAPDPAAYVQILQAAYRGAKRADPNVIVVSAAPSQRTGGLGGTMEDVAWLEGLYAAGAKGSFDALGVHAYLGSFDPTADPATCAPMCFRDVELYRAVMVEHGDAATGVYIDEMGALQAGPNDLGQYQWMALPSDQRADYLTMAVQMAARYPWVIGVSIFNFDYATTPWNPATTEKYWFSLLNADGSPRPVLTRLSGLLHGSGPT